jgi:hypothetical protein
MIADKSPTELGKSTKKKIWLRELKISWCVFVPEFYGRPPTDDRGVLKHAGAYSRKAACYKMCSQERQGGFRTRLFWILAVIRRMSVARGDVEISLAISAAPAVPSICDSRPCVLG